MMDDIFLFPGKMDPFMVGHVVPGTDEVCVDTRAYACDDGDHQVGQHTGDPPYKCHGT